MATTRTVLLGGLTALALTIGACSGSDDDDTSAEAASDVAADDTAADDAIVDDGSGGDEGEAVEIDAECAADADEFDSVQNGTAPTDRQVNILGGLVLAHTEISAELSILVDDRMRIASGDVPDPDVSLADITEANVVIGAYFDNGCER